MQSGFLLEDDCPSSGLGTAKFVNIDGMHF